MYRTAVAAGIILAALPGPAAACFTAEMETALIHAALPPILPDGWIVLEVTFDTPDPTALYGHGLMATVDQVLQGPAVGARVRVRADGPSTCDVPFANGASGLLVGVPGHDERGPFLLPIPAQRGDGFTLSSSRS
ncbi:hypothetical protein [Brevundimonas sp. FT23042]|uniref:hypothetical protein n=1 Tax=Brevundimonas sp. FT23042 TaxID=3393749 RepID=UPI003B58803C